MKTPKTPVQAGKKFNTPKSGGISKRKSNGVGEIKPFPGLAKAAQELKQSPFKKPTPLKGTPKTENGKGTPGQKQSPGKPNSAAKRTPKRKFNASFPGKTPENKAVPHVATPYPKSIKKESGSGAKPKQKKPKAGKKKPQMNQKALQALEKEIQKKMSKKKNFIKKNKKIEMFTLSFGAPLGKDQLLQKPMALKAVQALRTLMKKSGDKEKGASLLPSEDKQLLAQINVMKPCPVGERCMRLHLAHPIVREGSTVCLITTDHKEGEEHFKKLLKEADVTCINEVITFKTLRNEYNQFEQKRKLAMRYDLFFVEGKISHRVTPFLGKTLEKFHKIPTPVNLNKDARKITESALARCSVSIRSNSTSFSCQIGMLGQGDQIIADNLVALSDAINSSLPGGWKNVSSLHLRCDLNSVPVCVSIRSPNDVTIPQPKMKKEQVVEDELSTIPGARVQVHSGGKVVLKKEPDEEMDSDEDDEDFEYETGDSDDEDVGSAEDDLSDNDDSEDETPSKIAKIEVKEEDDEDSEDEEQLQQLEASYLKGSEDQDEKPTKKGKFNQNFQQGKQKPKPQGKNSPGGFKQNPKQQGKNSPGGFNKQNAKPQGKKFQGGFKQNQKQQGQKGSPHQNGPKKGGFFKGGNKKGKK